MHVIASCTHWPHKRLTSCRCGGKTFLNDSDHFSVIRGNKTAAGNASERQKSPGYEQAEVISEGAQHGSAMHWKNAHHCISGQGS